MNCSDHSAEGNDVHRLLLGRTVQICLSQNNRAEHFTHINTNQYIESRLFEHESAIRE
jgi:hypothetical protein